MKITVDLEDFYVEEESIATALKAQIIREAVAEIKNVIKDKIAVEITAKVREMANEMLTDQLSAVIADCIANHKVKGRYGESPDMTVEEFVRKHFGEEVSKKTPSYDFIEKQAKIIGEEIKKRYDMQFAAGIVQKLHESNLLKDENLAKLLSEPSQK